MLLLLFAFSLPVSLCSYPGSSVISKANGFLRREDPLSAISVLEAQQMQDGEYPSNFRIDAALVSANAALTIWEKNSDLQNALRAVVLSSSYNVTIGLEVMASIILREEQLGGIYGVSALTAAIRCQPHHHKMHLERGRILLLMGDAKGAAVAFRKAIETFKGDENELVYAANGLARAYFERRRFNSAAKVLGTCQRAAVSVNAKWALMKMEMMAWELAGNWQEALRSFKLLIEEERQMTRRRRPDRLKKGRIIAFFCPGRDKPWGPSSLGQGIGGSEEAVIHLSRQLAQIQGNIVEVYANPEEDDIGLDEYGVAWLKVSDFDQSAFPVDIFISWRSYALSLLPFPTAKCYLWLHDKVSSNLLVPSLVESLSGIFVLSRHHQSQLPVHALAKSIVTKNGICDEDIVDGPNHKDVFIFASHPERGLEQLLMAWPKIFEAIPSAKLMLFHGYPPSYDLDIQMAPAQYAAEMRRQRDHVLSLMNQPGVYYYGMVDQASVAAAYGNASFWLYPTSVAETSCISAIKATANGAIPITSRILSSGLEETCGPWDMGPPAAAITPLMLNSNDRLQQWADAVIEAYYKPEHELDSHRSRMKQWGRRLYTWQSVAEQWNEVFDFSQD